MPAWVFCMSVTSFSAVVFIVSAPSVSFLIRSFNALIDFGFFFLPFIGRKSSRSKLTAEPSLSDSSSEVSLDDDFSCVTNERGILFFSVDFAELDPPPFGVVFAFLLLPCSLRAFFLLSPRFATRSLRFLAASARSLLHVEYFEGVGIL